METKYFEIGQVTGDMGQLTCDRGHMTHDTWCGLNILLKFQL